MTNEHTTEAHWARGVYGWSPMSPLDAELSNPSPSGPSGSDWQNYLQVLEEGRLGSVFLKAWKDQYESAEDVRKMAKKMDITVVGDDEVDIGENWEDVFEMVEDPAWKWGPCLHFKVNEKQKEKQ
jgi:hypothetical protein